MIGTIAKRQVFIEGCSVMQTRKRGKKYRWETLTRKGSYTHRTPALALQSGASELKIFLI